MYHITSIPIERESKEDEGEHYVFVEREQDHFAHTSIVQSPVYQQQAFQESKLSDGEIRGIDGLSTFFPAYAYAWG